ncbi:MAG: hypothetical protein IAE82_01345 [Opitutaceae bacterium]|nr:hypothetical protein [Opitutaceae bacterium]
MTTPRKTLCLIIAAAFGPIHSVALAQAIDPDPEIFDGTRTKKDQIQQDEKKTADKWEDANLILYDSDEEGSEEGGQGRIEGQGPGYADGGQGGVQVQVGMPMPLPMPLGGGAGGQAQPGDMQIPMNGGMGTETDQQTIAGATPAGQQSTPGTGGPSAEGQPPGASGKPGEVSIGDPSQKIATAAQPVNKIQGGVPPPPTGEPIEKSKGEDTTTVPNSASGQQSGPRGGGVEKGDAMPTDI